MNKFGKMAMRRALSFANEDFVALAIDFAVQKTPMARKAFTSLKLFTVHAFKRIIFKSATDKTYNPGGVVIIGSHFFQFPLKYS